MSRARRKRHARRRSNFERVYNEAMRIVARTFGGEPLTLRQMNAMLARFADERKTMEDLEQRIQPRLLTTAVEEIWPQRRDYGMPVFRPPMPSIKVVI